MAIPELYLCVFILLGTEITVLCMSNHGGNRHNDANKRNHCNGHSERNGCDSSSTSAIKFLSSTTTSTERTQVAAAKTTLKSTFSNTKTATAAATTSFLKSSSTGEVSLAASSVFSTRPETVQTKATDSLSPVQQAGSTNDMTHSDENSTLSLTVTGEYDTHRLTIGLGVAGGLVVLIGALVVAILMFRRRFKTEKDTDDTQVSTGHVNLSYSAGEIQRASYYATINDNQCEGNNVKDKHSHNYPKSLPVDKTDEVHIDIQTPGFDSYDLAKNPSFSGKVDNYDKVADHIHYFILEKVDEQSTLESGTERQATDSNIYNTTDNKGANKLTDGDTYSHLKKLENVYKTSASTNQRMETAVGTDTYAHLKGKDEVYNTTSDTICSHIPEITDVYSRLHL